MRRLNKNNLNKKFVRVTLTTLTFKGKSLITKDLIVSESKKKSDSNGFALTAACLNYKAFICLA